MGGHGGFDAHLVDGVDHEAERPSENLVQVFFGDEVFDFADAAGGVDLADAFGQGGGFGFAEVVGKGVELAVDVGLGDVVQIDQGERTDAGAGESFRRPRADAAEADDADVRMRQALQGGLAVEAGDAAEAAGGWGIGHCVRSNQNGKNAHLARGLDYTARPAACPQDKVLYQRQGEFLCISIWW
ncbi:hypothetical protein HMPREF9120_01934 [Neisseria sp. oral taxon 020 str. F0370]|nr:hypothetical protein HMPREF9120_01934 [Neisseria sp. oral taxon 020 str. F0370]